MKFATKEERLPEGTFAVLTCQMSSGSAFSPTGGWFLNKEDDLYTLFETEQEAIDWIERKMERTYDLEMHVYDAAKNLLKTYNSYRQEKTPIDFKMGRSFWQKMRKWKIWKG